MSVRSTNAKEREHQRESVKERAPKRERERETAKKPMKENPKKKEITPGRERHNVNRKITSLMKKRKYKKKHYRELQQKKKKTTKSLFFFSFSLFVLSFSGALRPRYLFFFGVSRRDEPRRSFVLQL